MRRNFRPVVDLFRGRLVLVAGATVFLMSLVTIRLFVKSVVAHDLTQAKAEQQYLVRQAVEPRRGNIYASDAEAQLTYQTDDEKSWFPLATKRRTYALSVVPHNIKDKKAAAEALAQWSDLSSKDLLAKIDNDKLYLPPLKKGLTEEQKDQITALKLPGIFLTEEAERFYPENNLGSQVLGFVDSDGQGRYGLEQGYNEDLKGSGGEVIAERDVRGRLLSSEEQLAVKDGSDLVLTIDRNVQAFVESTLKKSIDTYKADSGTAVVMDVKTGGIIAMASSPDFNPNEYNKVPTAEASRFINPAINAVWEPGSIFKTIVMALAIDAGLVEPDTEGVFSNSVTISGFQINTAENKAFGRETMTQVLENSDNVAMVWVAEKLGNDKMSEGLRKFGFGTPSGVDLPGEVGGYLLNGKKWHDINRATMSFGQGISVTPLQLTTAMAALANGGKLLQPHIVRKIIAPDGTAKDIQPEVKAKDLISPATSAKIAGMMVSVVERGHGKKAKVPGYSIAGKTGTAQIPRPAAEGGGYYEDQHIGGFGGFFPADNPRFAMVVKLDRPKTVNFAESSAAPTFGEIARFMLNYYRIPPTEPIPQK